MDSDDDEVALADIYDIRKSMVIAASLRGSDQIHTTLHSNRSSRIDVDHHGDYEAVDTPLCLTVDRLSHIPRPRLIQRLLDYITAAAERYHVEWMLPAYIIKNFSDEIRETALRNVHFQAKGGNLTMVLGTIEERTSLIELITGRKHAGIYDGNVVIDVGPYMPHSTYYQYITFAQRTTLYIPGLTYEDMVTYSARLRNKNMDKEAIRCRVKGVLKLMELAHCANRVIPEYPRRTGEEGGELRRLSIAIEIVALPAVIVIDEPTLGFDAATSLKIMRCLKALAARGHVVLIAMEKPSIQLFALSDQVVLLSQGYSIYAGPPTAVEEHFCSENMGYVRNKTVDVIDFALDIASGVERPAGQRVAELPVILQYKCEHSPHFEFGKVSAQAFSAFDDSFFKWYGYHRRVAAPFTIFRETLIVIERAVVAKIKDIDTLKSSYVGAAFFATIVGYLQLGQGDSGRYATNLITIPYASTMNTTATLFVSSIYPWFMHVVNIHVICNKVRIFLAERASGVCSLQSFVVATIVSEGPFIVSIALIFSNIIYWMVQMNVGYDNYFFWIETIMMHALIGLTTAYMFAAVRKKEYRVRDAYLLTLMLGVLLSGFAFTLPTMTSYIADFAALNPIRWTLEGLMAWKFSSYGDGASYLETYGFQTFNPNNVFLIQLNFILFNLGVFSLAIVGKPMQLKHKTRSRTLLAKGRSRADSMDSDSGVSIELSVETLMVAMAQPPSPNSPYNTLPSGGGPMPPRRASQTVHPVLFSRAPTVSGRQSMLSMAPASSRSFSRIGFVSSDHGPTVMFKDVTYRVRDRQSPKGYKSILTRVSGQFDWGKLSLILGAAESGKSSLLHFLAGDTGVGAEITGQLLFNQVRADPTIPLWQRCGLVEATDDHYKDLSVREIVTYAMRLRCPTDVTSEQIAENVTKTIETLHLTPVMNKKVKLLSNGSRKRLSIAEELVHGPSLLLLDEPTTGLSTLEESILMMTFREMVNADRTVVATMHQPTAAVFKLFDTVLLLSKGHVLYYGPVKQAVNFFVSSPFAFDFNSSYTNPADFLTDISGGNISDSKSFPADVLACESYYKSSVQCAMLHDRFNSLGSSAYAGSFSNGSFNRTESGTSSPVRNAANPIAVAGSPRAGAAGSRVLDQSQRSAENKADIEVAMPATTSVSKLSMEIEESDAEILKSTPIQLPAAVRYLFSFVYEERSTSIFSSKERMLKTLQISWLLLERSFFALFNRYELIFSSCLMHLVLGCLFGWIMGESNTFEDIYNVIAFFAVGPLLLLFASVQFIIFFHTHHQVYLKETSRGLYRNWEQWLVCSLPLYLLRVVNSILFSSVAYSIIELDDSTDLFGFYMATILGIVLSGTTALEWIVASVSDVRSAYITYPAIVGIQFFFSGLFVKFSTLPSWLGPWLPSASVIRWGMQACFLNTYGSQQDLFPVTPVVKYSVYTAFLNLFGWGGKTKWFCFYMVLATVAVFRFLTLIAGGMKAFAQQGGRKFRKNVLV